jgi:hypothetical protein
MDAAAAERGSPSVMIAERKRRLAAKNCRCV